MKAFSATARPSAVLAGTADVGRALSCCEIARNSDVSEPPGGAPGPVPALRIVRPVISLSIPS